MSLWYDERMMLRWFAWVMLAVTCVHAVPALAAKTVILVRHAEKASSKDPDTVLSMAGEDRALHLARLLRNAGPTHVIVSDKKRTQQTAAPLAEQHRITPMIVAAADDKAVASKIKSLPADAVVVVVGHSNTVPVILSELGHPGVVIADDQYGRVFVVTGTTLVELAY
jgi:phosphohistidine phosphatase SixA